MIEEITIEGLNPVEVPALNHAFPVMKDSLTEYMLVSQIFALLVSGASAPLDTWPGLAAAIVDNQDDIAAFVDALAGKVEEARAINSGTGLTGGGDLSADRTLAIDVANTGEAQAGTSDVKVLTPLRLREALNSSGAAPVYGCRAWVNFNGIGTVAIRASGNVSSITDLGVGNYRVNFATAMPSANYAVNFTCDDIAAGSVIIAGNLKQNVAPTTTAVEVTVQNQSGGRTSTDTTYNSVSVHC